MARPYRPQGARPPTPHPSSARGFERSRGLRELLGVRLWKPARKPTRVKKVYVEKDKPARQTKTTTTIYRILRPEASPGPVVANPPLSYHIDTRYRRASMSDGRASTSDPLTHPRTVYRDSPPRDAAHQRQIDAHNAEIARRPPRACGGRHVTFETPTARYADQPGFDDDLAEGLRRLRLAESARRQPWCSLCGQPRACDGRGRDMGCGGVNRMGV